MSFTPLPVPLLLAAISTLPSLAPARATPAQARTALRAAATRKSGARVLLVGRTTDRPALSPTADGLAFIDRPVGKLGEAWLGVTGKVEFIDRTKRLVRVGTTIVRITDRTEFNGFTGRSAGIEGVQVADRVTVGGNGGGESLTADEIRLETDR